ncbi:oil body-associated protein 2C-like [Fagus crenata]
MTSSDKSPSPMPTGSDPRLPGQPMTMGQHMIDKGAQILQSLKPVKQMSQHVCTFALYSHDMTRQIETHHFITRVNQDFLQCAVYDTDHAQGRLIGVEYIVSDRIFEALPPEEQKLWHSLIHMLMSLNLYLIFDFIKSGLWVNPQVPGVIERPELENLAKTYGKCWCTWQVDRGDKLPLGAPSLMMSPQAVNLGQVSPELVHRRDNKYNISTEALRASSVEIAEPEWLNPQADYWKQHGKGFAIDIKSTDMKLRAPFP